MSAPENKEQATNENPELVTVTPNGESVPGGGTMTKQVAEKFFATRGDNFEKAVEDIKNSQLKPEVDGEFLGHWLLTQISYWNRDKERLVLLCEKNIIVCKYDFVAMKLSTAERIFIPKLKSIQGGKLVYPENSVCVPRLYEGVKICWGSITERPWYQKWNPFESDIPFATFTSHPVFSLPDVEKREVYDVKSFFSALKQALDKFPEVLCHDDQPIIIESYAGFISYVHNQSRLGFSRERGGVSF